MKKVYFFILIWCLYTFSHGQGIEFSEILNWSGTGSKVAMLIVDFNDGQTLDCYAFGYRFDGTITAQDMLSDIDNANPDFTANISGGFLNDIVYNLHSGIGGSPHYWTTLTFISSNWVMNNGIMEELTDSMIFGCSYTDWIMIDTIFYPEHLPENPVPAQPATNIINLSQNTVTFMSNPAQEVIYVNAKETITALEVYNTAGQLILSEAVMDKLAMLNVSALSKGVYVIQIVIKNGILYHKFIKL